MNIKLRLLKIKLFKKHTDAKLRENKFDSLDKYQGHKDSEVYFSLF